MEDYTDLINRLRTEPLNITKATLEIYDLCIDASYAIENLQNARNTLKNELCLKCGNYKQAHNGACNGCRWKKET